jgi:uncharacterized membrane protein YgdD (TMEM256/DUF423 family)
MWFIAIGAFFGLTGVVAGAFGAHALREVLQPAQLVSYQTGSQYQVLHALLLMGLGLLVLRHPESKQLKWSGQLATAGVVLFAGSIYGLTAGGLKHPVVIAATPIGGGLLIAAWVLLLLWAAKALYSARS